MQQTNQKILISILMFSLFFICSSSDIKTERIKQRMFQNLNSKDLFSSRKSKTFSEKNSEKPSIKISNPSSSSSSPPKKIPGPTCTPGMCCSNQAPVIPAGVPRMASQWWSTMLAHGAQIQIRSSSWNTWWTPAKNTNWNFTIKSFNSTQPPVSVFFKIIRVSDNQIMLQTPANNYVRAGPSHNTSFQYGQMDTTSDPNDPRNILTVEPSTTHPSNMSVNFKTFDGYYISNEGEYLLRWAQKPSDWESFDIREVMMIPSMRGANLGSWLLYENWMVPGLYSNPSVWKDGTLLSIQSVATNLWVTKNGCQKNSVCCKAKSVNTTEEFRIRRVQTKDYVFQFRELNYSFWSQLSTGIVLLDEPKGKSDFKLVFAPGSVNIVLIKAPNGRFLRTLPSGRLLADVYPSSLKLKDKKTWKGASAFRIKVVDMINGEWQLSSQYGPTISKKLLETHHDSFLTEQDWKYMQSQNINAVRIPVGYWLANASLGTPFYATYYTHLDWAFRMGVKYNIRIWLSMHGVTGSQSGWSNTGARDGFIEFHKGQNYKRALNVVRWLAQRYGKHPAWLGMGLMNEPLVGVPLPSLQSYYTEAYKIIRSYSPCAFISMEARIGSNPWKDVFFLMLDSFHTNVILESHSYEVFGDINVKTAAQEINYMKKVKAEQVRGLQSYGRVVLMGEFSNAMFAPATNQDQIDFGKAQLQTMGIAQAGWFFWALKLKREGYEHWNWYKSSAKGWLPRKPDGNWW